ncbi:hypothetical protein QFC22_004491 [Naganishia vaughanmartiniae]|uniref:Uncharacterized protein n=1 Tax=Naganishia vaughanmartiniae TaxID=1424756 RepID=A0ACC2X0Q4_9TREE|nr:hypothetical protein QFC22_004491 [Naganishia vaughanmartiniae]
MSLIESSKCSDGSGIALCMALARIYQQPHEFLRQHVYHMDIATHQVNPVNPNAAEFLLFPESLGGENIAQGMLITLIQVIHAADGVPLARPQERPATMSDFGIPATAKEKDLHDQLFPKNLKWWWNLWIHAEYRSWRDVLYYMVYKERLDMGERRYHSSQLSEMVDQTRGMRLAGWQVGP